jgi:DnaK suppressor protein
MNQAPYHPGFIESQRQALLEEKARLEKVLSEIAIYDAEDDHYTAKFEEFSPGEAEDEDEAVDEVVTYEERSARVNETVRSLNEVNAALQRIAKGEYGVCEAGGEWIPQNRLEAYPAAATCVEHEG